MIETILLILIIISLLYNSTKRPKNFPPGPIPWPIVGSFHLVDNNYPQNTLDAFYRHYGKYVGAVFGSFKVVCVNGWEAVNKVFNNDDILGRPDVCLIRDRFDGDNYGIFFTDGPGWKTQRRFTLHHIRNFGFGKKSHDSVIQEEAELVCDVIGKAEGQPFNLEHCLSPPLLNILWSLIGTERFGHVDREITNISEGIKESLHKIKFFGSIAVGFPLLRFVFPESTGYRSIKSGTKRLQEFVRKTIKEHSLTKLKGQPRDFIDAYLDELEKPRIDSSFSEHQLEGICIDLLYAGGDTSLSVLCFAILFLCYREELQEKIFEEVKENVGLSRLPGGEDRTNLVWTEAVLWEVLRMRSPAPNTVPHRCQKDVVLDGYSVPKDTLIIFNLNSIFMDPNYWEYPEEFRPERFITPEGKLRKEERLIPFGKGKRMCIGESLAKSTTFIFLSSMIQKYKFKFDPSLPRPNTEGVPGFTLAAPFFRVVATPRN